MLFFLIRENQLYKTVAYRILVECIGLTPKGIATLGDMENEGYVAKEKNRRKVKRRDNLTLYGVFGGILAAVIMPFVPTKCNNTPVPQIQKPIQVKDNLKHR
jgi:hypothetical protein